MDMTGRRRSRAVIVALIVSAALLAYSCAGELANTRRVAVTINGHDIGLAELYREADSSITTSKHGKADICNALANVVLKRLLIEEAVKRGFAKKAVLEAPTDDARTQKAVLTLLKERYKAAEANSEAISREEAFRAWIRSIEASASVETSSELNGCAHASKPALNAAYPDPPVEGQWAKDLLSGDLLLRVDSIKAPDTPPIK